MRRIERAKPSPALLVAVVALVAALVGTAVGGVAVTSLSKKDQKQANKQIKKKAPGLSVASAETAGSANSATTADSARPYAYAEINGSNVSANLPSRNISSENVSNPAGGIYCFDLPFTPATGEATAEAESGSDDFAMIRLAPAPLPGCPADSEVQVRNYDVSSAAQVNDVFYIQLSR